MLCIGIFSTCDVTPTRQVLTKIVVCRIRGFFDYLNYPYFRTKNIHDRIRKIFEKFKTQNIFLADIHSENMWLPLSLIFASNIRVNIAYNFSAVLLQTKDSYFIVGNQSVLNTYSSFYILTAPKDLDFLPSITTFCITPVQELKNTKKTANLYKLVLKK